MEQPYLYRRWYSDWRVELWIYFPSHCDPRPAYWVFGWSGLWPLQVTVFASGVVSQARELMPSFPAQRIYSGRDNMAVKWGTFLQCLIFIIKFVFTGWFSRPSFYAILLN